jgi:hypothetical protein
MDYLDTIDLAMSPDRHWASEDVGMVKAMTVSTNAAVRRRIIEIARQTTDPHLFASAVHALSPDQAAVAFQRADVLTDLLRQQRGEDALYS